MAVVVSDTTPLHYLVLIGQETVLQKLYGQVIVPPAVLQELSHSAAPTAVIEWAKLPPTWLKVQAPSFIPSQFDLLDFGEQQALALAQEIRAELILLDDKAARRFAERESFKVKGTLGIVADAAKLGLLNFRKTVETLQQTSMHLEPQLTQRLIAEYERWLEKGRGEGQER